MCLTSVCEVAEPRKKLSFPRQGWGWKVFKKDEGGSLNFEYFSGRLFKQGKWLKAEEVGVVATIDGRLYTSGFHLFATRKDARIWARRTPATDGTVVRIRYRELTYIGKQEIGVGLLPYMQKLTVLVAREIFVGKRRGR